MIKICSFLAMNGLDVIWVGREKPGEKSPVITNESFKTHTFNCIFGKGILFYLEFNIRLFFYLITRRYQVSYSVDLDTLPAHALAFLFKGKPIIFDAHEWFIEVPELQNRPMIRNVWKGIEKLFMPAVAQAITVGPALSELLEKETGIPYLVVRNIPFAILNASSNSQREES